MTRLNFFKNKKVALKYIYIRILWCVQLCERLETPPSPFYRYLFTIKKCKAGNRYKGRSPSVRIVELTTAKIVLKYNIVHWLNYGSIVIG